MLEWTNVAALLESPQGSTFFALIALLLTSAASFWLQSRRQDGVLPPGIVTTLELLMGLFLVEAAVFGAVWMGLIPAHLMPAIARGIHLLTLVAFAWLWIGAPAEDRPRSRLIAAAFVVALLVFGAMLILWLGEPNGTTFNYSRLDYAWGGASLLALLLGILLTFGDRSILGMVNFSILLLGQVAHHLLAEPFGNMPLAVEAALMLTLPTLFFLHLADATKHQEEPPAEEPETEAEAVPAFRAMDPNLPISSFEEGSVEGLAQRMTSDFAADLCVFAQTDANYNQLQLVAGYNALRDMAVEPSMLALEILPRLGEAIKNGHSLRLWADEREPELDDLSGVLRLSFQANLLAMPLTDILGTNHWIMLLLRLTSPWENEDENAVEKAAYDINQNLAAALDLEIAPDNQDQGWMDPLPANPPPSDPSPPSDTSPFVAGEPEAQVEVPAEPGAEGDEDESSALRERLADLIRENEEYEQDQEALQAGPVMELGELTGAGDLSELEAENARYRQDIDRLLAHIDELQRSEDQPSQAHKSNQLVEALQIENEELRDSLAAFESGDTAAAAGAAAAAILAGATASQDIDARQAREELRLALEQVADLQGQLASAQKNVMASESMPAMEGRKISGQQMEVLASIAQELRQPLSSVMGYTDLLLGESVGILGALQRKFLERVRKSTERMNTLIDNLIRIAELDEGGYTATRAPVDLAGVIDDTIGQLRPQLQEKSIMMRVDLPDQLPQLNTDRDALQQILYHLLENADAATPENKEIQLRAVIDSQQEFGDFVLIQVTDSGGGIPEEDLPRVFSRVYRTSNAIIPGVGDTGVGLTIAETLTQALGGRIWVETESGAGATFSVLLPLNAEAKPE